MGYKSLALGKAEFLSVNGVPLKSDEEIKEVAMLKQKYAASKKVVRNAPSRNVAETLLRFVAFCVSWISTPSVIKALSIKQGCVSCALVTRQLDGIGLGLAESGGSMKKKLNNAPTMSQLQKMSESVKFGNDSKRVQNLIKASEKRVAEKRG